MLDIEYGRGKKKRGRRKMRGGMGFINRSSAKTKSGVERVGVDAKLCVEKFRCVNRPSGVVLEVNESVEVLNNEFSMVRYDRRD